MEPSHAEQESINGTKGQLADMCAKAGSFYNSKRYDEAADLYARAAEKQAELNGEMSPENAEILYLYGRSVFRVGQAKSDVLGTKAAEEKPVEKTKKEEKKEEKKQEEKKSEDKVAIPEGKQGLFQFVGDENLEQSDESDEEEEGAGEGAEEEEDDLGVAFQVLDLARVLFLKKLEGTDGSAVTGGEDSGKGKAPVDPSDRHVRERLADVHDLLAEISLENERYPSAVGDLRESLKYNLMLHPAQSEVIAEAYFKLSLGLEFASITEVDGEGNVSKRANNEYDKGLRQEAVEALEKSIECTKAKLQVKEVMLAECAEPEDNAATKEQITEVREILADMEQRLEELRKPPVDVEAEVNGGAAQDLAKVLNEEMLKVVSAGATDLSSLVRKKRKADDEVEAVEAAPAEKKTRVEASEPAPEPEAKTEAAVVEPENQTTTETEPTQTEPAAVESTTNE